MITPQEASAVEHAAAAVPPQIKAVFFDLGKVLVHFDWTRSLEEISRRSPHSAAEAWSISYNDGARHEYECGRISTTDFFEGLREKLQFQGTAAELQHLWCDIFTPMDSHIALARELAKTHIVGIISNTNAAHIDYLEPLYPMFQIFPKERRIYSHDVHCMKPDRKIYDLAIATAGTTPETTLFIDDLEDNIHGVRALGWHAVHLRPETDLVAELKALGLCATIRINSGIALVD
ncbi:MAG: HAD family hydrolase [Candidatus Methylacidiphilales bacterium]|nr:HAD family phosphatase [Candidatus Methylacidiphilales bacterium]